MEDDESMEQPRKPETGGWSNLGERDLNTGMPADADPGEVPGFPDGNNVAGLRQSPGLAGPGGGKANEEAGQPSKGASDRRP
ncbi:MAG: hypothetical protein IVW57_07870 [Ktedonobacterales bacterium]|nr:hypothetical protein [Ktedonobacterales bacterium]